MAVKKKSADKPWEATFLWRRLATLAEQDDSAEAVRAQLILWLPKINTLLHSGVSQPKDFTLHDDGHALRVAQRMDALLNKASRENLSPFEVALLLLSAWLHDIGMVPAIARLQAHRDYLFTGQPGLLSTQDHAQFQQYLDERSDSPPVPFITDTPTVEQLDHADLLLSHYVRERHNAWSADWIRANIPQHSMPGYPDFRDDLIRLCDSHHRGYETLAGRDFDYRTHGHTGQPVALRYLACLLRVADILENSPDRVPDVIYRHRSVDECSILHWLVPHQCQQTVDENRISVNASPTNAAGHHALAQLAAAIDRELTLCADLRDAKPFGLIRSGKTRTLDWPYERKTQTIINPAPDSTYEYIDGTFRPDIHALLRLVAGEALYGTPLAAVRELLQNGFDAVREKIARRRLTKEDPANPAWEEKLGNEERVTLRLERCDDGHLYLICEDTGTGMTRDIIRDRLLVSGRPPGHIHKELERRCLAHGFTTGRTACFGIGCLSYFMLADEVTITTRRDSICGDASENCTWQFYTTGTDEFGELQKLRWQDGEMPGTQVKLRIKKEAEALGENFSGALENYLIDSLVRFPVSLRLDLLPNNHAPSSRNSGWAVPPKLIQFTVRIRRDGNLPYKIRTHLNPSPIFQADTGTEDEKTDVIEFQRQLPGDPSVAPVSIPFDIARKWMDHSSIEKVSPGLARVRVSAAWFKISGKVGMCWADQDGSGSINFELGRLAKTAWNGMSCRIRVADLERRFARLRRVEPSNDSVFFPHYRDLDALGYFDYDIDLAILSGAQLEPTRNEVILSKEKADELYDLCVSLVRGLAVKLQVDRPGTLLAQQMKELEEWFQKREGGGGQQGVKGPI